MKPQNLFIQTLVRKIAQPDFLNAFLKKGFQQNKIQNVYQTEI